ncbi:MAG: hypothetical protein WBC50_08935 [Dehalococcoidales bacterium]
MSGSDDRIEQAVWRTEIIRLPKQKLATFGTTNLHYYLLTEPVYAELTKDVNETVVREGRVIAEKPRIVTPYYLSHLQGFSQEASRYLDALIKTYGSDAPGLFYTYRNEAKELTIVSEHWRTVADRLNAEIDKRGDPLAAIVKGEDELWDVSLLKFIYEVARGALPHHVSQMGARGLLNMDASGVPMDARLRIEEMFRHVMQGNFDPDELKKELDRWNLFAEYEDRFFAIFKKK